MNGILMYEEMIRVMRANGLIPPDECSPRNPCSCDDERYKGMTFADVGELPLPLNRVCPVTKVIVGTLPNTRYVEDVKEVVIKGKPPITQVIDYNPCGGYNGVVSAIPEGTKIVQGHSRTTVGNKVVDNPVDKPFTVKTVTTDVVQDGDAQQPLKTDATEAVADKTTEDGTELTDV